MSTLATDTIGGAVDEAPISVPSSISGAPPASGGNTSGSAEPGQETNSNLPTTQEAKTINDELRNDSAAAVQPEKTEGADDLATTKPEHKDSDALAPDTSHVPPPPPVPLTPGKRGPKETFADFL